MNILFITYQGGTAGSTNSIAFLADGLARKGHNVFVGCRKESLLFKLLEDSPASAVPMVFKGRLDFNNIRHIRDLVREERIDIINAQSSLDRYTSILSRWIYKLNTKVIHTRRQTPKSSGGWLQRLFYTKGTDRIVVVSHALKRTFVKKGFPEAHLKVIHNGTPIGRYKNISKEKTKYLRQKFNISKGDKVIGCVSRNKRQYQLIEALQYLPEEYKVIFAGIENSRLRDALFRIKPKQTIHFAGVIDVSGILDYYALFDVNILASVTEGFGLTMVEAMALGVPVIGTAAEGILDVIEDEKNGLLFPDGEAEILASQIKRMLTDEVLRETCIMNGKNTALKKFSIENTINNYQSFFLELIK